MLPSFTAFHRASPERVLERTRASLGLMRGARESLDISVNIGVRAVFRYIVERDTKYVDHWIRHELHANEGLAIATLVDAICEAVLEEVPVTANAVNQLDRMKTHISDVVRSERAISFRIDADDLVEAVMSAVDDADPDLAAHLRGVGDLAGSIAVSLGFSPHRIKYVANAGRMHDIGKIGIP
jgi:HD-GYP domain-containing protein (c-di-GMP phosphodiesterase class II)